MALSPPRIAYQQLHFHLDAMRNASDLEAMADAWELFLIYHQRTWNRCEAHYKGQACWTPLLPKYSAKRKQDSLLQYVHQARHADEHGLSLVAEPQASFTVVSGGTIQGGSVIRGDGPSFIAPGSTAKVVFHPATVVANPVWNRGQRYDPPVLHGRDRPPVLPVAEEAIRFYAQLFQEIEERGGD